MSTLHNELATHEEHIDKDKDLYSLSSSGAGDGDSLLINTCTTTDRPSAPQAGIDAEVAQFFADTGSKPVEIDDATNRRLRWKIHKRVLVVMVVTYFAQTLDKGYIEFPCHCTPRH